MAADLEHGLDGDVKDKSTRLRDQSAADSASGNVQGFSEKREELEKETCAHEDAPDSVASESETERLPATATGVLVSCLKKLDWTPKNLRYDPEKPPKFTMTLNFIYAIVKSLHM
jgi:hypothetical protein